MDNPETLATLGTQDIGQRLEKTKGTIKNGQPRDTGNIGYIRHRTKGRKNQRDNQEVFSNICPVSCVLNVASVSGLSILDCPFGFLSPLSCVLCAQCCQCLWVVHSRLSLWFSLAFVLCLVCSMLPVLLEKTKGTIKNGQTRDTGNIEHTRHRTKGRENQRDNQEWTTQRHWQHWVHKSQDKGCCQCL
jgi:hypothetical protein